MTAVVESIPAPRSQAPDARPEGGGDIAALRSAADRVAAVPGVARVGSGRLGDIATYLPGERLAGVRLADGGRLELTVVAGDVTSLTALADAVRQASAWPGPVDVLVADIELDVTPPAPEASP